MMDMLFLVRSAFDFNSLSKQLILMVVNYGLGRLKVRMVLIVTSMVYVPNYGENWYGSGTIFTAQWDNETGTYHLFHELIPGSDENGMAILSKSNEGLLTGIGTDFGIREGYTSWIYDALALMELATCM